MKDVPRTLGRPSAGDSARCRTSRSRSATSRSRPTPRSSSSSSWELRMTRETRSAHRWGIGMICHDQTRTSAAFLLRRFRKRCERGSHSRHIGRRRRRARVAHASLLRHFSRRFRLGGRQTHDEAVVVAVVQLFLSFARRRVTRLE